jgi:hypothetical protein
MINNLQLLKQLIELVPGNELNPCLRKVRDANFFKLRKQANYFENLSFLISSEDNRKKLRSLMAAPALNNEQQENLKLFGNVLYRLMLAFEEQRFFEKSASIESAECKITKEDKDDLTIYSLFISPMEFQIQVSKASKKVQFLVFGEGFDKFFKDIFELKKLLGAVSVTLDSQSS